MSGLAAGLARLTKLAEQATPGPWYVVGPPWNREAPYVVAGSNDPHVGRMICDGGAVNPNSNEWDDMPFIAAVDPLTVRALCDAAEALDEVHEFLCGCDAPGSSAKCVAESAGTFAALARLESCLTGTEQE